MASDRDTLAAYLTSFVEREAWADTAEEAAEYIESALRWRPPAREITTAAELDALPDDSIVVDHHNAGWQMADRDYDGTAIWMYHTAARTSAELLGAGARVALVFVPIEAVSDDDQ